MEKISNVKNILLEKIESALYLDGGLFDSEDKILDYAAKKLDCGIRIVQYSDNKRKSGDFLNIALKLRQLCSFYDALFIIEDRLDVAKIVKSDGVLLSSYSIPSNYVVSFFHDDIILGYKKEVDEKLQDINFDYVLLDLKDDNIANSVCFRYSRDDIYKKI